MDKLTAATVFSDLVSTKSFTETAERLDMSRAMVTRYVGDLEDWLQVRLFHRTTRRVSLTSAGEQCQPLIQMWLDMADNLQQSMKPSGMLTGKIRVATSMSFGHAQLIPALSFFLKQHPKVAIDIDLEDQVANLAESQIDLAIRIASNPDPSLIGKPIAICQSVIVASPEYLARMPQIKEPQDLINHDCLGYRNFERHVWHLSKGDINESVDITSRLTANEATTLLKASLNGMGIALQPSYLANQFLKAEALVQVLPDWAPNDLTIYALYSSRKHLSPSVRELIDYLSNYFADNPW
jgi:DNA-binding transcriptional LysR family regulator